MTPPSRRCLILTPYCHYLVATLRLPQAGNRSGNTVEAKLKNISLSVLLVRINCPSLPCLSHSPWPGVGIPHPAVESSLSYRTSAVVSMLLRPFNKIRMIITRLAGLAALDYKDALQAM